MANGQFRSYEMAFTYRHFLKKITDKSIYPLIIIIITDTIMIIVIMNTKMFSLQQNILHDWFLEEI